MSRFQQILNREGENVTWHKRSLGATPDPETGDLPVSWTTETIKAIVQPARVEEIIVEAGHTVEDYLRLFTTADIKHGDQITYRGERYEALTPEAYYFRGQLEYYTASCRKMTI